MSDACRSWVGHFSGQVSRRLSRGAGWSRTYAGSIMITADEVIPLPIEAAPSFSGVSGVISLRTRFTRIMTGLACTTPTRGAFARHLIGLYKARSLGEIEAAFGVIERLHLEGDSYVSELATIRVPGRTSEYCWLGRLCRSGGL